MMQSAGAAFAAGAMAVGRLLLLTWTKVIPFIRIACAPPPQFAEAVVFFALL
jgi:hypothetical protein